MSRITEIEIAGTKYPLNFSIKASEEIAKKYGDLENINEAFKDWNETTWLLHLLIEQGIEYKKIVDKEEIKSISLEELKTIIGFYEAAEARKSVMEAITVGSRREVETEPDPNEKTTQK